MLTRTFPMVGSRRSLRVLERNVMIYRAQWVMLVSGFFEPLFYLLSIGIGLNKLVGNLHVTGGRQLRPVRRAGHARRLGDERRDDRLDLQHVLPAEDLPLVRRLLSTPLEVTDIAMGEGLWALTRATMYSASFIVCMAYSATPGSAWVVLCWPGAILTSLTFSCMGLAACTFMRTWQDFDLVLLVQLPLFLFSGTFFPVTLYPPGWARSSPSQSAAPVVPLDRPR
jgi:lipooligosaccharide transport system permease protein